MRGGYQIIDFKGVNFEPGIGKPIEGVYDLVSGTDKPIMITNFVVAGAKQHDFFAQVRLESGVFKISTSITNAKTINISNDDSVTIAIN